MIHAFCQIGHHAIGTDRHPGLPNGWRYVPATLDNGHWVYKTDSGCKIVVCNIHVVPGEPHCDTHIIPNVFSEGAD